MGIDFGKDFIAYGTNIGMEVLILNTLTGRWMTLPSRYSYGLQTMNSGFMLDRKFICG